MAGIVLPLDTSGKTAPVPRWVRGIELDYSGTGSGVLEWEAENADVLLFRAVDCRARFRIGSTGIWSVLLAGQAVPQTVSAGETAVLEALEAGRLEIHAFRRTGVV